MSHHLYPNSYLDYDLTSVDAIPLFSLFPDKDKKNFIKRFGSWIYVPMLTTVIFQMEALKFLANIILQRKFKVIWEDIYPFLIPIGMILFGSGNYWEIFIIWNIILSVGSFSFASLGFIAGHYHPDNIFDGDALR